MLLQLHGHVRPLMFIEGLRYDEASSLMIVPQASDFDDDGGFGPQLDDGGVGPQLGLGPEQVKEAVPAKVFQTECHHGVLLVATVPGDAPQFVYLTSETAVCPQVLQRNTGNCIAQALMASSTVRLAATAHIPFKLRLITSDRFAAQFAAERAVTRMREGWQRLHLGCEVHMSCGSQAKSLLLCDAAISGMVRFALCLRSGGWMRVFRKALRLEILATLDIQVGQSSEEDTLYRSQACATFAGNGRRRRLIQSLVSSLPNGCWENHSIVQVFLPEGTRYDRSVIARIVASALVKSLAGTQFLIFNRSRWSANDDCVCRFGLMEACHGLLSRTFKRWLPMVGHSMRHSLAPARGPGGDGLAADGCEDEACRPQALDDLGGEGLDGSGGAGERCADDEEPERPESDVQPQAATESKDQDWAKKNAKNRSLALEWVLAGPLKEIVICRLVMEPNMKYLRKQLWMGSHAWESKQVAKSLQPGQVGHVRRDFRLLVAARGEMELEFFEHQRALFIYPKIWTILPKAAFDEATRCLIFRMLSRAAAEFERLIARPHRLPPFRLFLCFAFPHIARELKALKATSPCVLDPFTLNFLNAFDPESVEGKMALGLILQLGRVDTARVECFHAWVKRLTTRLGAQASRPNFQDVAARVFCHRVKERQAAHEPWMGRPVAATDDANQPEHDEGQGGPPGKALRTGGGGSWRAHCKRMFSQGVRDYATLGPAYRERSAELVQADLEAGAEATARRRRGEPAFGDTKERLELQRRRALATAALSDRGDGNTGASDAPDKEALVVAVDAADPRSVEQMIRVVRLCNRMEASKERSQEKAVEDAIVAFAVGQGQARLQQLAQTLGLPKLLSGKFHCFPDLACRSEATLGLASFLRHLPDCARTSSDAVDKASQHGPYGLLGALDVYWGKKCLPVYDEDWKGPEVGEADLDERSPCCKAGMCICSPSGLQLFRFRNSVLLAMKRLCPKNSVEKQLLREGHLVLRMRGVAKGRSSLALAQWFGDDDMLENSEGELVIFWHVAFIVLAPYMPIFQAMDCKQLQNGERLPDSLEVELEARAGMTLSQYVKVAFRSFT